MTPSTGNQNITPSFVFNDSEELLLTDQTALPLEFKQIPILTLEQGEEAIVKLRVRGAPAIALFALYVLYLEMRNRLRDNPGWSVEDFAREFETVCERLHKTRPTAVNLDNELGIIRKKFKKGLEAGESPAGLSGLLLEGAKVAHKNDGELCRKLGELGAGLIPEGAKILTHCNTGALATGGIGTAIGAFYTAHEAGLGISVFADETRPLLQGARITAWELDRAGIPVFLITDNMAAFIMKSEGIDLIMVGADRIAANGDTANKIGTMGLAVLARHFNIPFYVVAPGTTLDPTLATGESIPIEERKPDEVRRYREAQAAPPEIRVRNPAFDVTPAELITAIITETGVHKPPYNFS